MTCACPPDPRVTCPWCDGQMAELLTDTAEIGEACIAFEEPHVLCAHRAEPGTPYCTEHQVLDVDLPVEVAA